MEHSDQFRFVSLLALELDNGDIDLPSLPDVVMKIRKLLEDPNCDFVQISNAIKVDAVLVSRLFVFANSAYYNRANVKIETLDAAIGRLGFEVVRNTAMSLAMKQLYNSDKHDKASKHLRKVWARGMKFSCMAHAVSAKTPNIDDETAFLCGLMHEVGKLYILTKAEEFPEFIGDEASLNAVMDEWTPQITKSIVESWGFPEDVIESTDPEAYLNHEPDEEPTLADVVHVAKILVDDTGVDLSATFAEDLSCKKMGFNDDVAAEVMDAYRGKLKTMQESLAG